MEFEQSEAVFSFSINASDIPPLPPSHPVPRSENNYFQFLLEKM